MRTTLSMACAAALLVATGAFAQTPAEQRAILRDFERAAVSYVDRFAVTDCSEVRPAANEAAIFTLPVSMVFRQLIAAAFGDPHIPAMSAPRRPVERRLDVYQPFSFAGSAPLPTVVAAALPALPSRLEYRFVGHDLVLRDVECNLVVAVLRDAIRYATTLTQVR